MGVEIQLFEFGAYRPCALCTHGVLPDSPRHQPTHQVLKTIYSNIRSSAPEDGHNDARNMLSNGLLINHSFCI